MSRNCLRIAVLGATGPSGVQVVTEALGRGHEVTAIVRDPDKMNHLVKDEKLKVVTANIYEADTMVEGMTGRDAVLSCLGCPPSWFSRRKITFYTDTAEHIVTALRKASANRFIFMSSWSTVYNPDDPFILNKIFKPLLIGESLHNMGEMEEYMKTQCQDIDFTSVKPPQLVNGASSGKPVQAQEGQVVPGGSYFIKRSDVAKFMLDTAETGNWKRACVAIAT